MYRTGSGSDDHLTLYETMLTFTTFGSSFPGRRRECTALKNTASHTRYVDRTFFMQEASHFSRFSQCLRSRAHGASISFKFPGSLDAMEKIPEILPSLPSATAVSATWLNADRFHLCTMSIVDAGRRQTMSSKFSAHALRPATRVNMKCSVKVFSVEVTPGGYVLSSFQREGYFSR